MCSCCKNLVSKDLSVRTHQCPYCGFVCDRDINASINIVNGIPDNFKQEYSLLRNDTAGTVGILTPVEMIASIQKSLICEQAMS